MTVPLKHFESCMLIFHWWQRFHSVGPCAAHTLKNIPSDGDICVYVGQNYSIFGAQKSVNADNYDSFSLFWYQRSNLRSKSKNSKTEGKKFTDRSNIQAPPPPRWRRFNSWRANFFASHLNSAAEKNVHYYYYYFYQIFFLTYIHDKAGDAN